jgi:L-rhamnose-H+ transport protein
MFGGFTTNFIWCVLLNIRNGSGYEYLATEQRRATHAKDVSIIFSTIWGWISHEWKGSSKKAHRLIVTGIATLILSTIVVGVGGGH